MNFDIEYQKLHITLLDLSRQHKYMIENIINDQLLSKWNDYIEQRIQDINNVLIEYQKNIETLNNYYELIRNDREKLEAFNQINPDFLLFLRENM
jgi:site-specific DNA-adenine methylase